ncbi:MAG: hypothetical protein HEP71_33125 [Roseivirga sp.]|nr:hypothetical protein [Roseivirga sp.]
MEIKKLNSILLGAIEEDGSSDFREQLGQLIISIEQAQSKKIETVVDSIIAELRNSVFNDMSISNHKILEEIGANDYFGLGALDSLEVILEDSSFNTAKTVSDLKNYVKKRNEFIRIIKNLKSGFDQLGFSHHISENDYEFGLLLPSGSNYDDIKIVTKELNKWDKAIKAYRELVGLGPDDTKLTLVNNGSLEFFTENPEQVALCISFTLERLFKLYKNLLDIRGAWDQLRNTGLPKAQERAIKKHEQDTYNKEIDSIVTDVVKKFVDKNIEAGRLNELKISIKGHTNYFAKCIDNGLVIEINPPEIAEPEILNAEETEENKKEKAKAKADHTARLKQIKNLKRGLEAGKEIYGLGKEVFRMLTTGSIDTEEDTDQEEIE